jgi:hypothetical protein
VPLPLSYLIEPRFAQAQTREALVAGLEKKLYLYEIEMKYGVDAEAFQQLKRTEWVRNKWLSLKGSSKLLRVELCELEGQDNEVRAMFRIGSNEKDCQEAIDLVEYLCFMLAV